MADPDTRDTLQPAGAADLETPPATTEFQPAAPLKDAGVEFGVDDAPTPPHGGTVKAEPTLGGIAGARQAILDSTAGLRDQAGERARGFAEDGKAKATDALGQLSQLLNEAAGQVDDRLGQQYGQYARTAADQVQTFSSSLQQKSIDDLIGDARELVRKSPAVAVGAAAALGFVVARLITAGIDQRDA